jgi:GT2 family glycosyltransferase
VSGAANWHAVVLHWGRTEDTAACLASLDPLGFARLMLVDNGSRATELESLAAARPNATLVRNAENRGYAGGNNVGIRMAVDQGAEFVAVVNNDVVVEYPRLLDDAESAFQALTSVGVVSPQVFYQQDGWHAQRVNLRFERAVLGGITAPGGDTRPVLTRPVVRTETFTGCCWMVPAPVVARVGLLREDFFLYHEELEYAVRLRQAGLFCAQIGVGAGRVLHKGGTTAGLSPIQAYYGARNLLLLPESAPPSLRTRLLLLAWARVGWMVARCLASGRVRSAARCVHGLADGLRGARGSWRGSRVAPGAGLP